MQAQDVVNRLVQAYPPYASSWATYSRSDEFDPDLPYTHLGDLATFLVDRIEADQTEAFASVFAELENLLAQADSRNRDLLIVGFLEDLQNISLNRGVALDRWAVWLGGLAKDAWMAIRELWSGKLSTSDFDAYIGHRAGT
jgi:hypothetical protein